MFTAPSRRRPGRAPPFNLLTADRLRGASLGCLTGSAAAVPAAARVSPLAAVPPCLRRACAMLTKFDYINIAFYFAFIVGVGVYFSRKAKNTSDT